MDAEGKPIKGVYVSLSGSHSYRNNSATNGLGMQKYEYLYPGTYYIRPILKEYVFKPSQTVCLTSLSHVLTVSVNGARRWATGNSRNSCWTGSVQLLRFCASTERRPWKVHCCASGWFKGTTVCSLPHTQLTKFKGEYEETQTEKDGTYRLRGLLPDSTYVVRVKR